MNYEPVAVTHLVDYGTISFTWSSVLLIAMIYLTLFASIGFVLFCIYKFFKRKPQA